MMLSEGFIFWHTADELMQKKKSQKRTFSRRFWLFWRSKRDLNPRGPLRPYALSRGASSTS